MPLKKDLTVLTVSFCEKRKEMKMLDQTNETIVATFFFTGSFHTWIFIKYFYATETEDYKNVLRIDSIIYYKIKLI